jgi:hypothetical protein
MLSIDQSPDRGVGMATTSFSLDGSRIKFAISQIHASYNGTLSADGTTIAGIFTQGLPIPLEFRRATNETAWTDPSRDCAERAAGDARDEAASGAQAKAFEIAVPSARVVRLPHANHFVFISNEDDVLREMKVFLSHLP